MTFNLDTPEVRRLLGLKPHPTSCRCCGKLLIPVGTKVKGLHGWGNVASWSVQDHWNVPVSFKDGTFAICARPDLTVKETHGPR